MQKGVHQTAQISTLIRFFFSNYPSQLKNTFFGETAREALFSNVCDLQKKKNHRLHSAYRKKPDQDAGSRLLK